MTDYIDYIPAISLGTQVADMTGKGADGFTAGGYASFVQAVTGSMPSVVPMPGNRAKIVLSKIQAVRMQQWLDRQLGMALAKPKVPPSLEIDMGPALVPWALKYAVPAAMLFIVIGWVAHHYFAR